METSVSEIHAQPLRPPGFEEPLFLGRAAKKEIAEHLAAESGWLRKTGEETPVAGDGSRTGEVCHVLSGPDGGAYLVRARRGPVAATCERRRVRKCRVTGVLERWRDVRYWWAPGRRTDRLCFRVLLAGGAVVDLALERSGSWSLLRVQD